MAEKSVPITIDTFHRGIFDYTHRKLSRAGHVSRDTAGRAFRAGSLVMYAYVEAEPPAIVSFVDDKAETRVVSVDKTHLRFEGDPANNAAYGQDATEADIARRAPVVVKMILDGIGRVK